MAEMNVKCFQTMHYGDVVALGLQPNKANRRPLAGNPKHEILNPKQDESRLAGRAGFEKTKSN